MIKQLTRPLSPAILTPPFSLNCIPIRVIVPVWNYRYITLKTMQFNAYIDILLFFKKNNLIRKYRICYSFR